MGGLGLSRYAFSASVVAALLAGCGGSQPPIGAPGAVPQSRVAGDHGDLGELRVMPADGKRSIGQAKDTGPLLYVTNFNSSSKVTVYRARERSPAPIEVISEDLNSPIGDCIDRTGTLYVGNDPASGGGWISEYPFGKSKASLIVKDGISTPGFCAIDSGGDLWVTNLGGPNVTEYLPGSKKPHTVITKGLAHPVAVAFDRSGNLYVSNRPISGGSYVAVYPPGAKTPRSTITDGITSPVGIAVDATGVLYVENVVEQNVEEYLPGAHHPFKTITQGLPTPIAIAVSKTGWLYVANGAGTNHRIVEFAPGTVDPSKRHVSKALHLPSGVSVFPPVLP